LQRSFGMGPTLVARWKGPDNGAQVLGGFGESADATATDPQIETGAQRRLERVTSL
jgi:hypothetical protein